MSQITWTPAELLCELGPLKGAFWRAVEAQHKKSTMKLVGSSVEQAILEEEIEAVKPPIPAGLKDLDWLLYTPFRYGASYPKGSRFRRAGLTEGVFYCCETPHTAMAEKAFWQLMFFAESPGLAFLNNPIECTVFSVRIATSKCLDLTKPALMRDADLWNRLTDYSCCQEIADCARQCGTEALRYPSVRDPNHGLNVALLSPRAFASPKRCAEQSWHLQLQRNVVWAKCEAPACSVRFEIDAFLQDDRLAPLRALLAK